MIAAEAAVKRRNANGDSMGGMSQKISCTFCGTKIDVEQETLPVHETEKGSGQRCDGSGLPVENMSTKATSNSEVVTDGGSTGKAS